MRDYEMQISEDVKNGEFRAGLSLTTQIYDALRKANMLREWPVPEHER